MKMIQRLQLLEHLTPTEQILVDYLKENPEEFIGLKPKEVSDKQGKYKEILRQKTVAVRPVP